MPSVKAWRCVCGAAVSAQFEPDGQTIVRCPTPTCDERHAVSGTITGMWIEKSGMLQPVDFHLLIISN
jgi:hypothetical protein